MQRERHPKFEITLIRKTRTNSSDFCLEIHFVFFKNRNYQFLKNRVTLWYALSRTFSKKRKHPFRFFLEILLKSTENRKECFLKISVSL